MGKTTALGMAVVATLGMEMERTARRTADLNIADLRFVYMEVGGGVGGARGWEIWQV